MQHKISSILHFHITFNLLCSVFKKCVLIKCISHELLEEVERWKYCQEGKGHFTSYQVWEA